MDFPAATPGKNLNDTREAQGLGPPFHCEFGRCTGAGEEETRYCSQHRCQWPSPSDSTPCKRARLEAAFGHALFAYCLTHKCRNMECGSARQGPMAYCAGHMCRTPNCRGGSEHNPASAPMYCPQHECVSVDCRRPRRRPAEELVAPEEEDGVVPSDDATLDAGMGYCSQHARRFHRPPGPRKKKRRGCCTW